MTMLSKPASVAGVYNRPEDDDRSSLSEGSGSDSDDGGNFLAMTLEKQHSKVKKTVNGMRGAIANKI